MRVRASFPSEIGEFLGPKDRALGSAPGYDREVVPRMLRFGEELILMLFGDDVEHHGAKKSWAVFQFASIGAQNFEPVIEVI